MPRSNYRSLVLTGTLVLGAPVGLTLAACTLGSDTYIYASEANSTGGKSKDASAGSEAAATTPTADVACFEKVDFGALTPCGGGAGHCFEAARAPLQGLLVPCAKAGEVCVPDEALLATGGTLKACTSIIGPGGCITSALLPKLDEQKSVLTRDVCEVGQLCAPCTDPTNGNAPTPFCQPIGAYKTKSGQAGCAGTGPSPSGGNDAGRPPEGCCTTGGTSRGVCVPPAAISPAGYQGTATRGSCSDTTNRCEPAALAKNAPVRCTSTYPSAKAGKAGVCLDTCFFDAFFDAAWKPLVTQTKDCAASELCIPCDALLAGTPGCGP